MRPLRRSQSNYNNTNLERKMDVSEGKPCTAPPHASRRPVRVTQKGRRRRKKKKNMKQHKPRQTTWSSENPQPIVVLIAPGRKGEVRASIAWLWRRHDERWTILASIPRVHRVDIYLSRLVWFPQGVQEGGGRGVEVGGVWGGETRRVGGRAGGRQEVNRSIFTR